MQLMVYFHTWANDYYVECNTPLARSVGHVISVLSVKWAFYYYKSHMKDRFDFEFGNGMLCFMDIGYMMVDILCLEQVLEAKCAPYSDVVDGI